MTVMTSRQQRVQAGDWIAFSVLAKHWRRAPLPVLLEYQPS
jgi:hypothetical protein